MNIEYWKMKKILQLLAFFMSCLLSASLWAQETAMPLTLTLTSAAFEDQSMFPKTYTCDGKDISPALNWHGAPKETQSFVLIVSDLDAPGGKFYHWILYNLPASMTALAENVQTLPAGVLVGKNSWGKLEYNGPCPPKGAAHYYIFSLYALNRQLDIKNGVEATTVMDAMQAYIITKAELSATYGRSVN